jgi:hypothetical protein
MQTELTTVCLTEAALMTGRGERATAPWEVLGGILEGHIERGPEMAK